MTVQTIENSVSYVGDGIQNTFSFNFKTFETDHIKVYLDGIILETTRTVNLYPDQEATPGGTVVFDTAPLNGVIVSILRMVPITQLVDYQPYDPFPAETHERALDKLTMISQQLGEENQRAVLLNIADTQVDNELEPITPGYYIAASSDGTKLEWRPTTQGTFLTLPDTPSSFTGASNYFLRVNSAQNAVEFVFPDHALLANSGVRTHAELDAHLADSTIHYPKDEINHQDLNGAGTYTHAQLDGHIDNIGNNPHGVPLNKLSDVFTSSLAAGNILVWQGTRWENETNTAGNTFIGLNDTPAQYAGFAEQYLRVTQAADGVEFVPAPSGGGSSDVPYNFVGNGTGDPSTGSIGSNNADNTLTTELRVSYTDGDGNNRGSGLLTLTSGDLFLLNADLDGD
jgi:hypothetical protein